jgi:hypothetical protein
MIHIHTYIHTCMQTGKLWNPNILHIQHMDVFICLYYIEVNKTEMLWEKIRV